MTQQLCNSFLNMQLQEHNSIKIESHLQQKQNKLIRTRRAKKMEQLRNEGFFSEEAIKLRHPLLYHTYLGQHSQKNNTPQSHTHCTLSQFLHKNLINLQYRDRLSLEIQHQMQPQEKDKEEMKSQEGWQVLDQVSGEITITEKGQKQVKGQIPSWQIVEEEQIQLEEQNLIDHAQELFMEGKVDKAYINYTEIDNCSYFSSQLSDLDSNQQQDREKQEKYLNGDQNSSQDQRINSQYYTGIQDY